MVGPWDESESEFHPEEGIVGKGGNMPDVGQITGVAFVALPYLAGTSGNIATTKRDIWMGFKNAEGALGGNVSHSAPDL